MNISSVSIAESTEQMCVISLAITSGRGTMIETKRLDNRIGFLLDHATGNSRRKFERSIIRDT